MKPEMEKFYSTFSISLFMQNYLADYSTSYSMSWIIILCRKQFLHLYSKWNKYVRYFAYTFYIYLPRLTRPTSISVKAWTASDGVELRASIEIRPDSSCFLPNFFRRLLGVVFCVQSDKCPLQKALQWETSN